MFNGYDKSKWGDTIEQTEKLYPGIKEISMEKNKQIGIRTFEVKQNKDFLSQQVFDFYNGKLYSASLYYLNTDDAFDEILVNKIMEKYGKPNEVFEDEKVINDEVIELIMTMFYLISIEMVICITIKDKIKKNTEEIIQHNVRIHYYSQEIMNKINSDKTKMETGYEYSKWGDSIEKVLQSYPFLVEIKNENDNKMGLRTFSKEKKEDIHWKRTFDFYNDKLYRITLNYYDLDEETDEKIMNKFLNKYSFFETENKEENQRNINDDIFEYYLGFTFFLNNEMEIKYISSSYIHKFTEEIMSTKLEFQYFNPEIIKMIKNEIKKYNINEIIV